MDLTTAVRRLSHPVQTRRDAIRRAHREAADRAVERGDTAAGARILLSLESREAAWTARDGGVL